MILIEVKTNLSNLYNCSGIKINTLCKVLNMNKNTLYKYLNGEREPTGINVHKMRMLEEYLSTVCKLNDTVYYYFKNERN